jgi:hypothetical protein
MTGTRSKIVFVVLLAMLAGFVVLGVMRTRAPHTMPAAVEPTAPADDAGADGAAVEGTASAPPPPALEPGAPAPVASAPPAPADAGAKPILDRPLRVVAVGWELLAAGIVANGGRSSGEGSAFAARGLPLQLRTAESVADVERQLARGGADADGADVALVPLPALVGAYEHLRVLEPQAFLLVGWSRGREALLGAGDASLSKPRPGDVRVFAPAEGAPLGLALFALDAVGDSPSRVRVVQYEKDAQYAALARPYSVGESGPSKLLLTTGEASRLVPLVMVAPRALIGSHADALTVLTRGWLDGMAMLRKDVPAAARLIAHEQGAPEPATLLDRLGQVDWASITDNVRAFGIAGRPAAPLASLFSRFWRLYREAGLVTTPLPDSSSIPTTIVATLAKADPKAVEEAKAKDGRSYTAGSSVLLVASRQETKGDDTAWANDIALLAGVFEGSVLRVSARRAGAAQAAVDRTLELADIPPSRLVIGVTPPHGAPMAVEVLAAQ